MSNENKVYVTVRNIPEHMGVIKGLSLKDENKEIEKASKCIRLAKLFSKYIPNWEEITSVKLKECELIHPHNWCIGVMDDNNTCYTVDAFLYEELLHVLKDKMSTEDKDLCIDLLASEYIPEKGVQQLRNLSFEDRLVVIRLFLLARCDDYDVEFDELMTEKIYVDNRCAIKVPVNGVDVYVESTGVQNFHCIDVASMANSDIAVIETPSSAEIVMKGDRVVVDCSKGNLKLFENLELLTDIAKKRSLILKPDTIKVSYAKIYNQVGFDYNFEV